MELEIFQVDAFTNKVFGGNPAAIVPLENWLPDATLQSIAMVYPRSRDGFVWARHVSVGVCDR